MEKMDDNGFRIPHTGFPLWFQILIFFLKEKYQEKYYKTSWSTLLHGAGPVQQSWEGNVTQYDIECLLWEDAEQCCMGSACSPSPMRWTICLYHTANPEVIISWRTAFDSLLPLLWHWQRGQTMGCGLKADTAEYKRETPEFKVLIKDLNFNVANISRFSLGYVL